MPPACGVRSAAVPCPTPRDPPPPIAPQTTYFGDLFALGMFNNARWQISQHQYAAGVLVAQAAVEMGVRNAFIRLLDHDQQDEVTDEQLAALPDVSFMEEETRRLWTRLSGYRVTRPKNPPVWSRYHWHVERRNEIAHGDRWGDDVGYDCVVAAGAFIMRLDEQMAAFDVAHP
jgi:hypothetical protein